MESAATVPPAAADGALLSVVREVAAGAHRDIAAELLWPGRGFVGARWARDEAHLLASAVRLAAASDRAEPARRELDAVRMLSGKEPADPCDFVEIGVVNEWAPAGPVRLWERDAAASSTADAVGRLDARPDLLDGRRPLAVEVAARQPRPFWLGVYVTTEEQGRHVLDRGKLLSLL